MTDQNLTTNAPVDQSANGGGQHKTTKIRPNEPCPCGSGKKYKFCHGAPRRKIA